MHLALNSTLCASLVLSLGAAQRGSTVEISMLANEGFLLRSETASVLIDAFVAEPYSGYDHLDGETLEALVSAREPFDSITLALASHVHRDHFQPEPARLFMRASPKTVFATSPQVLEALDETATDSETIRTKLPAPGEIESLKLDGVEVDFLNLSHGTGRFRSIENLGHVIEIGGLKVLHVGDAAISDTNFAPYALAEREIDVALIPYWYFSSRAGIALLEEHVSNARLIACHIPGSELEAVRAQLARDHPEVIVMREVLEKRSFTARRE